MHDACERVWKYDDDGPNPAPEKSDPETVDPLESGCARALADVLKYDTNSNYATMAAREFLAMWRFVENQRPVSTVMSPLHAGIVRKDERLRIQLIIRDMITDRLRFIGLLSPECARERTLAIGALQEVLDAIDPPFGPIPPQPAAAHLKVAA